MRKLIVTLIFFVFASSSAYAKLMKLSKCYNTKFESTFDSRKEKSEFTINTSTGTVSQLVVWKDSFISTQRNQPKQTSVVYKINHYDEENIYAFNTDDISKTEITINLKTGNVFISLVMPGINFAEDTKTVCSVVRNQETAKGSSKGKTSKKQSSSGTAFFINNKGYLLTNNHVIDNCKTLEIKYYENKFEPKVVSTDANLDLALLKVNTRPRDYINFSNDSPKKLQKIYVAGFPLGKGLSDDLKITSGIISSLKGFKDNTNEIQVDAAMNPGNSGGPIVNQDGELVAIAVAGLNKQTTEGINFGIKSSAAELFVKINKSDVKKSLFSSNKSSEKLLNLLENSTVYITCD